MPAGASGNQVVSVGSVTITEGDTGSRVVKVPVTLAAPATSTVSARYRLVSDTAAGGALTGPGADFNNKTGKWFPVTFLTGQWQKIVTIQIYGDTRAETVETFSVELGNQSAGLDIGDGVGTVTILDDDPATGRGISVGDATVSEGDTGKRRQVSFPVTLTSPANAKVTVTYRIVPDTATGNYKTGLTAPPGVDVADYLGVTRTLSFPVGSSGLTGVQRDITVFTYPDTTTGEGDETFHVELSNVTGPAEIVRGTGTGTILDDETPTQAPVQLTPVTISGTARVGQTLTANRGSWAYRPASYSYRWDACNQELTICSTRIESASNTYTPIDVDGGQTFRVTVTATNAAGSTPADPVFTDHTIVANLLPVTEHCGTITQNETWGPGTVRLLTCGVTVPSGVTLTISPNTIVKAGSAKGVSVAGVLRAEGTAGAPIVFTSERDDSVGGDSNGDGTATSAYAWVGITVSGTVDVALSHVDMREGGIFGWSSSDGTSVVIDHSTFTRSRVQVSGFTTFSVAESVFTDSPVNAYQVVEVSVTGSELSATGWRPDSSYYGAIVVETLSGNVSVVGNVIEGPFGRGIQVSGHAAAVMPVLVPEVRNNTVSGLTNVQATGPGCGWFSSQSEVGVPVSVGRVKLDPAKLSGNHGTGNARNEMVLSGELLSDLTLPMSGSFPVVIGNAAAPCSSAVLEVPAGVTLTIEPGTVVKVMGQSAGVSVAGVLRAEGTAGAPIVFTSERDDSVGGDSNGDGTATSAYAWVGITVSGTSASAALDRVAINDAYTGVYAGSHATARVTQSIFRRVTYGASADSTAFVNATGSDWGSASGPAPWGSGAAVSGNVLVFPWAGYVPPAIISSPPAPKPSALTACSEKVIIGARGSGESPQGTAPDFGITGTSTDGNAQGFGTPGWFAANALASRIVELRPGTVVKRYGLKYPALPVPELDWSVVSSVSDYGASIDTGVNELWRLLHTEGQVCSATPKRVALVGYSQGALVIHLTLRRLEQAGDAAALNQIGGVALIADPARVANGAETLWEGEYLLAGSGVSNADGVWQDVLGGLWESLPGANPYAEYFGPLPSAVTGQTISLCHNGDPTCAWDTRPVFLNFDEHTNYWSPQGSPQGTALGRKVADRWNTALN